MLHRFLSLADANRVLPALRKLARHDIGQWALTGGLAVEIHHLRLGRRPLIRSLNDLDFVTSSFECIPETLAADFLFRHIHPFDPPGKTLLQLIDPDNALRIDVFRACGATMSRTFPLDMPSGAIQVISLEDLVARAARLSLDLVHRVPVPCKHARDFLRLLELVNPAEMETVWQDHRKPKHPRSFEQASSLLRELIPAHPELLMTPEYARDPKELCPRCASTTAFQLAAPNVVMALLGYC